MLYGFTAGSLHHNLAGHLRMYRAEVLIRPRILKRERKLLVRIKRSRFEFVIDADNGMRHVVLIDPCHLRAHRHLDLHGPAAEIVDGPRVRGGVFLTRHLSCSRSSRLSSAERTCPQSAAPKRERKNRRCSKNHSSEFSYG